MPITKEERAEIVRETVAAMAEQHAGELARAREAGRAEVLAQGGMRDIPRTSVAGYQRHPQEVTLQFRRWHAHGSTAYQRGQQAGFLRPQAEELVRRGIAVIVAGHSEQPGPAMVQKGAA
ncbi:hypothetical protein [Roseomonas chloroacetimidivorans]|uniref:hypothetical protein n=1 Tax=Roseomonas chloroacetimidivorans TaxID=1766656 RepID=UPI003C793FF3